MAASRRRSLPATAARHAGHRGRAEAALHDARGFHREHVAVEVGMRDDRRHAQTFGGVLEEVRVNVSLAEVGGRCEAPLRVAQRGDSRDVASRAMRAVIADDWAVVMMTVITDDWTLRTPADVVAAGAPVDPRRTPRVIRDPRPVVVQP